MSKHEIINSNRKQKWHQAAHKSSKLVFLLFYSANTLLVSEITTPSENVILKHPSLHKGTFNNCVDKRGCVGGQLNVYTHKVKDLSLFASFV